jgi:signal transduction histidine kinase
MRWALARVALATTSMVALAFLVPLALVVRQIAQDRAISDAERQASAMVTVLAITNDPTSVFKAIDATAAGKSQRLAVHLPFGPPLGKVHASSENVALAFDQRNSFTADAPGGMVYLQATTLPEGADAVIEVYLPESALTKGVGTAWLALSAVALTLVIGSVVIADRLGAKVVGSARSLAHAARAFGGGDLRVRVRPGGPPELAEAGQSFNAMASRVVQFLDAERELAADLSHRLRTPLTALRLDVETLGEGTDAERIRQAVGTLEREIDTIIRTARRPLSERGPGQCDVAEVINERLAFWSALAEDQDRSWQLSGATEPAPVPVQRAELSAVVDALLGNIFKHTPQGTSFAVAVHKQAGGVVLVVEDAGPGVAHPRAAVRRGASGGGSTGLGLDIARKVAESTGGSIHFDRGRLGGACVRLLLATTANHHAMPAGKR